MLVVQKVMHSTEEKYNVEVAVTDMDDEGEELGGVYAEVVKLEVERIELSGCDKACKTGIELMGAKIKS